MPGIGSTMNKTIEIINVDFATVSNSTYADMATNAINNKLLLLLLLVRVDIVYL